MFFQNFQCWWCHLYAMRDPCFWGNPLLFRKAVRQRWGQCHLEAMSCGIGGSRGCNPLLSKWSQQWKEESTKWSFHMRHHVYLLICVLIYLFIYFDLCIYLFTYLGSLVKSTLVTWCWEFPGVQVWKPTLLWLSASTSSWCSPPLSAVTMASVGANTGDAPRATWQWCYTFVIDHV